MPMAAHDWTYGYYGFVLKPAEEGEQNVAFQQGKESAKNNWLSSEIFSDVGFRKGEQAERAGFYLRFCGRVSFTSDACKSQILFICPSQWFFLLDPSQQPLRLWLMLFISLTPWCILHVSASRMFVFWLGSRWDKERLLVWPDPCLAPKCESGF